MNGKIHRLSNAERNAFLYDGQVLSADQPLESHGQIQLANDSRFTQAYFNEPLTAYAVGYRDPNNIEDTLNFIAPKAVVSARNFTYNSWTNAEEFFSDLVDDERAIGADFKKVEYTVSKVSAKTANRGLTMRIDLDEVAAMPGWENTYLEKLKRRLLRSELRRAVAAHTGSATNTAKTWDTTAGKDPDQDVSTDLIAAATSSGIRPNRIVFGDTAWDKRKIAHRAQNNAGGYASALKTIDEVATSLLLDGGLISKERYQSGTATKTEIVNNLVLEFYVDPAGGIEDPSNLKRFVTPTLSGGDWRAYSQQISAKLYDITLEYYSLIKVTSSLGLRKLTIS